MRSRALIITVLALIFGAVLYALALHRATPPTVPAVSVHPYAQPPVAATSNPQARSWREYDFRRVLALGTPEQPLLKVAKVQAVESGDIFVLDWGALSVVKFNSDGKLIERFGKGRGRGPGEMLSPTDFAVTEGDQVWVLDPGQGRIAVFNSVGEPARTIPVTLPALRFLVFSEGDYVLLSLREFLFSVYASGGEHKRSFGQFLPDQASKALVLEGEMARVNEGEFVYASRRAGYLARFDLFGNRAFYTETVVGLPYPPIEILPSGGYRVDPKFQDQVSTLSVSASNGKVFALTTARFRGREAKVLDVYDATDGSYDHSVVLPDTTAYGVFVAPDYLLTVSDTTVVKWTW